MDYSVIYSKRKSLCLEIDRSLNLTVRAPIGASKVEIESFVSSHSDWIEKHIKIARLRKDRLPDFPQTQAEKEELKARLRTVIYDKVEHYSRVLNLYPNRVSVTSARTRYGSCSGKNNICFSCYLALFPDEAIDYVVVHELCHIKYKNHGKEFYSLLESVLPDYKRRESLLKR